MPTGDPCRRRRGATNPPARKAHGFTYLWLLLALAAGAAGLALAGEQVQTIVQRDREAELMFRGRQIAVAVEAYREATPGAAKQYPATLLDLLEDRRGPRPLRHLRRLYADPFTAQPDWVLLRGDEGGIVGVRSRSEAVALRTFDLPPVGAGRRHLVSDRRFVATSAEAASAPPKR